MGRPASLSKRMALPEVRAEAAVNADVGASPSPRRGRDKRWGTVDDRWGHLIARQGRRRRSEHDHFLRDIAESATPRCAAPGARTSLQIDLRALRDTLHHGRPAARPGAHGGRRSRHRQFGACRRDKGYGKAKPKTKTRNHFVDPVVGGQGFSRGPGFQQDRHTRSAGHSGVALWRKYAWPNGDASRDFRRPPCRTVWSECGFDAEIVIGRHRAKGQSLVRHDQGRLIAHEHYDVAPLLKQRFRHRSQAIKVWRPPPRPWRPGIDLAVDEAVRRIDREHKPRPIGPPFGRHGSIGHPQAEKLSTLIGRSVVDPAAFSGRAMLAPRPGRLGEFRQRVDLAAERAGAALASRRGRIRRKEQGG
jgi:hypothetical protein